MSKYLTLYLFFLIVCATQSDGFKIISKIKNYLLPTTTSTTAIPIVPDYEQNETKPEIPWGEEATEENIITTTIRSSGDHEDTMSYLPRPTPTLQTTYSENNDYMPTKNRTLFPPPKGQPLYPGMPTSATITQNGENDLIPENTTPSDVRRQSTIPKSCDSSYCSSKDHRPVQNPSQENSDASGGPMSSDNQKQQKVDSVGSSNDEIDMVDLFANLSSNNTQNSTGIAGSNDSGDFGKHNSNGNDQSSHETNVVLNSNIGNQNTESSGNDCTSVNGNTSPNGNQNCPENNGNSKGNSQQTGENNGYGKGYGNPNAGGNQNVEQNFDSSNNETSYGKPASNGNSQQTSGSAYGKNAIGQSALNKNNTKHSNNNDDGFIFPDHPSLNSSPESEVGGSRLGGVLGSTPKPNKSTVIPVDDGRIPIDAPLKKCGKGRKLNNNGECRILV